MSTLQFPAVALRILALAQFANYAELTSSIYNIINFAYLLHVYKLFSEEQIILKSILINFSDTVLNMQSWLIYWIFTIYNIVLYIFISTSIFLQNMPFWLLLYFLEEDHYREYASEYFKIDSNKFALKKPNFLW